MFLAGVDTKRREVGGAHLPRLKAGVSAPPWVDDDPRKSAKAFYAALKENVYRDYCGPDKVEVRGEIIDVWAYHTGGWSGNESIIDVLQESWLWDWLLERYDRGGHYYFRRPQDVIGK